MVPIISDLFLNAENQPSLARLQASAAA